MARTGNASLVDLLFGQTRGRILGLLLSSPETAFFVRQIARKVNVSLGAVQRELTTLTAAGLILRSKTGSQVFYRVNREHPIYPELRGLLEKTTGIFHVLSEALLPLLEGIRVAFVYGSVARGEENGNSDVDLMLIGSVSLDEVLEQLVPLERKLGRPINPTIYSENEWKRKLKAKHHFLKSVQQGQNIFLIGNEHELRELR